jgi:hypothetical protein
MNNTTTMIIEVMKQLMYEGCMVTQAPCTLWIRQLLTSHHGVISLSENINTTTQSTEAIFHVIKVMIWMQRKQNTC